MYDYAIILKQIKKGVVVLNKGVLFKLHVQLFIVKKGNVWRVYTLQRKDTKRRGGRYRLEIIITSLRSAASAEWTLHIKVILCIIYFYIL